jgi:hypothetical protein
MIGTYKLNEDSRFRCGVSSFGLSAGANVEVKQFDKEYRKVLIDFGGRDIDWFSDSILSKFTKENQQ